MAPEMVLHKCADGRRADLWSLGTILFLFWNGSQRETLRLQRKFVQVARQGRAGIQQAGRYGLYLAEFVEELKHFRGTVDSGEATLFHDLVLRLLTIDPSERITASQALQHQYLQLYD